LKALAIIFVVINHAAVTYSGVGSWFYIERSSLGNASFYFFLFYQTFSQAYFMSLFFAISAFFIPDSLARKGTRKFIEGRMFRLGVPTLVFIFFIFPICVRMVHPDFDLNRYWDGIRSFRFLGWTGPMWFTLVLLIFTLIYVVCKKWCDALAARFAFNVTAKNILALSGLIGMVAFAIRLVYPIGTSVMNLQFCFFSAYFFMFFLGIFAREKNIFEKLDYQTAKKWFVAAFAVGVPWWILIVYFGITPQENGHDLSLFVGGWNWIALSYALWESFFCVAIIVALVGIFKEQFNTQTSLQKFLSTNSFGVYIFHAPILIAVSVLLKNLNLPPILKFIIVTSIVLPACFIISHLIRKIPLFRKIFS
jgi:glucans biosynthesis protein C